MLRLIKLIFCIHMPSMQDCGKCNKGSQANCFHRSSRSEYASTQFSKSYDKHSSDCTMDFSSLLPQDSDDSDCEIFRVKRRSSMNLVKRPVNHVTSTRIPEHQVISSKYHLLNTLMVQLFFY